MSSEPWKSPYVVTVKPPEGFTAKPDLYGNALVTVHQTQYAKSGPGAVCIRATASYHEGCYDLALVEKFVRKRTRWHRVFSESRWGHVAGGENHTGFLQARTVEALAREAANAWEANQCRQHAIRDAIKDATGEEPLATLDFVTEVHAAMSNGWQTFKIQTDAVAPTAQDGAGGRR